MSRKRARSPQPQGLDQAEVYISSPIEDRGSTHIGLYSPTVPAKTLQKRPDVKEASCRIAAWRTPSTQKSISGKKVYDLGHDDDGEEHAGKKLEKLLVDLNVEGAVVVARWFGGILLGPVRFVHFENCARGAISKWRESVEEQAKRRKVAEEEKDEREKLARALEQRDESIIVLRALLAEKTSSEKISSQPTPSQEVKKPEYSSMDLPTLKRLEKARDGTLAWILKQIDKAEQAQKRPEEIQSTKVSEEEAQARAEEFEKVEKMDRSITQSDPETPS